MRYENLTAFIRQNVKISREKKEKKKYIYMHVCILNAKRAEFSMYNGARNLFLYL